MTAVLTIQLDTTLLRKEQLHAIRKSKIFQKIVGKLLYYARTINPIMFMALNSLAELQTKLIIETAKKSLSF